MAGWVNWASRCRHSHSGAANEQQATYKMGLRWLLLIPGWECFPGFLHLSGRSWCLYNLPLCFSAFVVSFLFLVPWYHHSMSHSRSACVWVKVKWERAHRSMIPVISCTEWVFGGTCCCLFYFSNWLFTGPFHPLHWSDRSAADSGVSSPISLAANHAAAQVLLGLGGLVGLVNIYPP